MFISIKRVDIRVYFYVYLVERGVDVGERGDNLVLEVLRMWEGGDLE